MGPRRHPGADVSPRRDQAAMEEGRDGPSEGVSRYRVERKVDAAMEEGRDGPSEAHGRRPRSPRPRCRNGGGPRWALGGGLKKEFRVLETEPQWRRAEMGPRRLIRWHMTIG